MTCLNPENICLWRPEDMNECLKRMEEYSKKNSNILSNDDNSFSSCVIFQFNIEFKKAIQVFSCIRDFFGDKKYIAYVNEFMNGIRKKILIEKTSRKTKKKGTRKRIPQSMFTCMSNDIYKLLSKESIIKNSQRSQSDCNDKDTSTLSIQSNDKDISTLSIQSNDKDTSTLFIQSNDKDISTLSIQSNDKDISTLSIQSTGDEDRSRCSKKRQYTSDYDDVEDDDNDGDYCDIKRKRISAEQRRKRSDINRKNSNKRWHKDG